MTTTYSITRVKDAVEVYRYQCDGDPLTFDEYPAPEFLQAALPPTPPSKYDGRRELTHFEFLQLFALDERIAIRSSADPVVIDSQQMMTLAGGIDLDLALTQQTLGYLASVGLIGPSRVAEILRG